MKKVIVMAAFAAAALVACKKENKEEQPKTNAEKIIGTWISTKISYYAYDQTNDDTLATMSQSGALQTMNFTTSGKVYTLGVMTDTLDYTVSGNNLSLESDDYSLAGEIEILTESQLVVNASEVYVEDSITYEEGYRFELAK